MALFSSELLRRVEKLDSRSIVVCRSGCGPARNLLKPPSERTSGFHFSVATQKYKSLSLSLSLVHCADVVDVVVQGCRGEMVDRLIVLVLTSRSEFTASRVTVSTCASTTFVPISSARAKL